MLYFLTDIIAMQEHSVIVYEVIQETEQCSACIETGGVYMPSITKWYMHVPVKCKKKTIPLCPTESMFQPVLHAALRLHGVLSLHDHLSAVLSDSTLTCDYSIY